MTIKEMKKELDGYGVPYADDVKHAALVAMLAGAELKNPPDGLREVLIEKLVGVGLSGPDIDKLPNDLLEILLKGASPASAVAPPLQGATPPPKRMKNETTEQRRARQKERASQIVTLRIPPDVPVVRVAGRKLLPGKHRIPRAMADDILRCISKQQSHLIVLQTGKSDSWWATASATIDAH